MSAGKYVMSRTPRIDIEMLEATVVALLDRLPQMDDSSRSALDPIVLMMASLTVLNQRYALSVS